MPSSSSTNDIRVTEEGLFVTLPAGQRYVIVDAIPSTSVNRAVDAAGKSYPLTVVYGSGKYLLRADLPSATYPVTYELRTASDVFSCCLV